MSIWTLKEQTPMERDENLNMVETIKIFQKDVQSHKANNERLMRAKE